MAGKEIRRLRLSKGSCYAASGGPNLLGPAEVLALAGVHQDGVALADEGGYVDLQAGLQGGRLVLGRGRRALEGRIGLHDLQLDGGRQLDAQRLALEEG